MWQEIFYDAILDAVLDVLKMVPILFLAYLLVAYLSHDHNHKFSGFLSKQKRTSVLYASFLGCVPQCGFSTVIADLYSKQKVTLGTLVAVFVATSDEAIPIMISTPESVLDMLILIGIKIVLALLWGYGIDFVVELFSKMKRKRAEEKNLESLSKIEKSFEEEKHTHHHEHECGHIHTEECDSHCHHTHGDNCADNIFLDAFLHTFEISIYVLLATFVINILVGYFSIEIFETILTNNPFIQILIASLVGLIPNCASSVFLVEFFLEGGLCFPALVAGLTTGAGVGLFILVSRNKKHPLKSLGIIFLQFFIGVVSGMFLTLFF